MSKFSKILVPIDFSEHSRRALERALWLADTAGAEVEVLHVARPAEDYEPLDRWIWGKQDSPEHSLAEAVRDSAQKDLDAFMASLNESQRSRCGVRLEQGRPSDVVVQVARDGGFDLIVMGTHGRSGAPRLLLGSVAERVLRGAPCCVLVVR